VSIAGPEPAAEPRGAVLFCFRWSRIISVENGAGVAKQILCYVLKFCTIKAKRNGLDLEQESHCFSFHLTEPKAAS
jgi:hypothetical protein